LQKLRRNSVLIRAAKFKVEEFTEGETKQRSRPLEPWKFPKVGRSAQKLKRTNVSRQIGRRKDLDCWFIHPGGA
jgi:hypothetical protein